MISPNLIKPESIVVVGGSDNTAKPGGKILENLINGGFKNLFVINPKAMEVQGVQSYKDVSYLPQTDLAILAIPATNCLSAIKSLHSKGVEAYIIISAGFSELNDEGNKLEGEIIDYGRKNNLSILGPNCIGIINQYYKGVFTLPVPDFNPKGVDFFSSSGSVAVFSMEAGMKKGLRFSSIYSVGNAAMIKIEDLLEYHDLNYNYAVNSQVLMIYIEQISDPEKFIKHCRSLNSKSCNIVGVKSGLTDAGMRAASSHTGAMASTEVVVNSIFKKAGVIQCHSREEMLAVASVLFYGKPRGKNVAVITHAGGSGVMTADALEKNNMCVPLISGNHADQLLSLLYPGSSVSNPVDFLATGTAEQLGLIIDHCNNYFENIDEIIVIFGSPGLFDVSEVYRVLSEKIDNSPKPVYPVLPSLVNTETATKEFMKLNKVFFSDEVILAKALAKVYNHTPVFNEETLYDLKLTEEIKHILINNDGKFLNSEDCRTILEFAGIELIEEYHAANNEELLKTIDFIDFPLVFKAIGPLHKTDVGGVILDINTKEEALKSFEKIMKTENTTACLIQPMIRGIELYAGANKDEKAGHIIMFGMGGIYLEILKDIQTAIIPVTKKEIDFLLRKLKMFQVLEGARGKSGIDISDYTDIILKLSRLLIAIPQIAELDINPLIANNNGIFAVDWRIRIEEK